MKLGAALAAALAAAATAAAAQSMQAMQAELRGALEPRPGTLRPGDVAAEGAAVYRTGWTIEAATANDRLRLPAGAPVYYREFDTAPLPNYVTHPAWCGMGQARGARGWTPSPVCLVRQAHARPGEWILAQPVDEAGQPLLFGASYREGGAWQPLPAPSPIDTPGVIETRITVRLIGASRCEAHVRLEYAGQPMRAGTWLPLVDGQARLRIGDTDLILTRPGSRAYRAATRPAAGPAPQHGTAPSRCTTSRRGD